MFQSIAHSVKKSLPLALMLMSLTLPAMGGPGGRGEGMGDGMPPLFNPQVLQHVSQELKLDAATTKKLEDIAYQSQVSMTRQQAEIKVQKMELKRLLDQDRPEERDVLRQVEALNKLELDLRKQRISTMLTMRSHLTPDQRQKLKAMHEERMKERGERRGQGRGGKHGGGRMGGGPGGPGAPMDGPDDE